MRFTRRSNIPSEFAASRLQIEAVGKPFPIQYGTVLSCLFVCTSSKPSPGGVYRRLPNTTLSSRRSRVSLAPCSNIHYTIRQPSTNHATATRPAINPIILEAPPSRRSRGSLALRVNYTSLYVPRGCVCALSSTGPAICPLSCGFGGHARRRFICDAHDPSARRWFRCHFPPFVCTNMVVAYAIGVTILQFGTGRCISTLRPSPGGSRRFSPSRDIIHSIVVCVLCLSLYSGNVPDMKALAALCTVFTSIPGCRRPLAVRPPRGPISTVRRVSASTYPGIGRYRCRFR